MDGLESPEPVERSGPAEELRRYYAEPAVRRRIGEFLGGWEEATALFVTAPIPHVDHPFLPLPVEDIWEPVSVRAIW